MKTSVAATAFAVALLSAPAAHAASKAPPAPPTNPNPPTDPQPSVEPDYYNDPVAGVSLDGVTGVGVNAVPVTPVGSTSYATPNYGSTAGLGGFAQGGISAQGTTVVQASAVSALGQVFTAPGGVLNQISFLDTNSALGGEELRIAKFDPTAFTIANTQTDTNATSPLGATLYSATASSFTGFGDGGGANGKDALFYHTFSNINLALDAGDSYYAYIVPTAGSQVFNGSNSGYASRAYFFELATQSSPLGGEFVGQFASTGGFYRLENQAAGTSPFVQAYANIAITPAAVDPGAVPEPATWGLMLAGFGLVGAGLRARRRSVAFA